MEFKVPELGEGVHEGELVKWRVKEGDVIEHDHPILEIMTDKATIEIPSPIAGTVTKLHAKEGQTIHVGDVIITFVSKDGQKSAPAPMKAPEKMTTPSPASMMTTSGPAENLSPSTRVLAAPSTRRMAREMGVDLSRVAGTGPHGRVMREDLNRAGGSGAVAAGTPKMGFPLPARTGTEERVPFKGLRKKIAEKMRLSKDRAAHFTYVEEADCTELVKLRNSLKAIGEKQGIKVTYLPILMKAMVAGLKKFPILNSTLDEEKNELVYKHYFNIGLSVQTDDGLTAPVIKDVGNKGLLQIAKEIQETVDRARTKKLTMEDLTGGTITLTNAGTIGGLFATPIINFPEVSILGFNKIARKPVVVNQSGREEIQIRDWTYFSISLDHRIVDGAVAAEFLKYFIQIIENPALLVLGEV